jgi:hypothetical protein
VKRANGQRVRLSLEDVHLPDADAVVSRITGELEVEGEITLLSDSGAQSAAYAVVQVPGILVPLIVPTASLRDCPQQNSVPAESHPLFDATEEIRPATIAG